MFARQASVFCVQTRMHIIMNLSVCKPPIEFRPANSCARAHYVDDMLDTNWVYICECTMSHLTLDYPERSDVFLLVDDGHNDGADYVL